MWSLIYADCVVPCRERTPCTREDADGNVGAVHTAGEGEGGSGKGKRQKEREMQGEEQMALLREEMQATTNEALPTEQWVPITSLQVH